MSWRGDVVDERLLVRQTGRDIAAVHSVVVAHTTCAALVFEEHVVVDDEVTRSRTSTGRSCTTILEGSVFLRNEGSLRTVSSAVHVLHLFPSSAK